MTEYKIYRWDVILSGTSDMKTPMIYIKPDLAFLEFSKENNDMIMCKISGTNSIYDGKLIPGVVTKSSYIPNCRPNFFQETGYYTISLYCDWYGYPNPDTLGNVSFSGFVSDIKKDEYAPVTNNNMKTFKSGNSVNDKDIGNIGLWVGLVLLILFLLFVIFFWKE